MSEKKTSVISEELQASSGIAKYVPKSKRSKGDDEVIFLRLDKEVVRQFRILSAELGKSQKELGSEALNMVFARYGKPQIA